MATLTDPGAASASLGQWQEWAEHIAGSQLGEMRKEFLGLGELAQKPGADQR
jgi:hypothetical protein